MKQALIVGAGCAVIRFPEGYYPSGEFDGEHDPMHCKVLFMRQGGVSGAIVTLELPSVRPWELTDELRAFAAGQLGIPFENTWLVMTHDLAAPHVPLREPLRGMHMDALRKAVSAAAAQARDTAREAVPSLGESICAVNANRDMESADGWWVGTEGSGPSDKTLTLLRFDDLSGKPVAALYSYAIKSSVLEAVVMSDGKRYASGDVTGAAGKKAQERLGCPVLFVMGAAGDQVPRMKGNHLALDRDRRFVPVNLAEASYEMLEELSEELFRSILDASQKAVAVSAPRELSFLHRSLLCPGKLPYPKTLPAPPVKSYTYEETLPQALDIWTISVAGCVIIGVRPEIPTPIFAGIRRKHADRPLMMATLVNGGQGYIATDWDLDHFTYPGLNTPFRRGTDTLFADAVNDLLAETV